MYCTARPPASSCDAVRQGLAKAEALPPQGYGAVLVILLIGDAHISKRAEAAEHRGAPPSRVLRVGRRDDAYHLASGGCRVELALQSITKPRKQGVASGLVTRVKLVGDHR